MGPKHSIDFCPICGGGLCGVRICGVPPNEKKTFAKLENDAAHGLIVCDECEAIWLSPDVTTDYQYADSEDARCPICLASLWSETSRWADQADIDLIGWSAAINHDLDANPDQGIA